MLFATNILIIFVTLVLKNKVVGKYTIRYKMNFDNITINSTSN